MWKSEGNSVQLALSSSLNRFREPKQGWESYTAKTYPPSLLRDTKFYYFNNKIKKNIQDNISRLL